MATLITLQGPNTGRAYACNGEVTSIGRQLDCDICLESAAVSRQHAQLVQDNGEWFVEDLGSSNGTYLNGQRLQAHVRTPLTEKDTLQIGPYHFTLNLEQTQTDPSVVSHIVAQASNSSIYTSNAAHKLQVVIEIVRSLGRHLEIRPLLETLLEQLLRLFPQADRGMVLGCEGDKFRVLAQRVRHVPQKGLPAPPMEGAVSKPDHGDYPYSRALVRKALDEGVGLLSEDGEANLPKTATLMALNLKSFLCVPLLGQGGEKMGVIQLDCLRPGRSFKHDDLELLTAVALQTAVVLENAVLHEQRLREESLRRELALAREIQQSFLPRNFKPVEGNYDLFAQVVPAHGVSGDLYDIFPLPDGRLALFVGDVSGKGMPAALFMIAVHTLTRHLAGSIRTPGGMLQELNAALVADNPTSLFVTLTHAIYDPRTGELAVSSGGHLPPLLRRSNGLIESIKVPAHLMLGYMPFEHPPAEVRLTLQPGETFVLYTDGLIEAFPADRKSMFGVERLTETLAGLDLALPLPEWANRVREAIAKFTGLTELQDDQTMLLLRRT